MAWVCSLRKSRESTSRWLAVELIRLYLGEEVVNRCFESGSGEGVFGVGFERVRMGSVVGWGVRVGRWGVADRLCGRDGVGDGGVEDW